MAKKPKSIQIEGEVAPEVTFAQFKAWQASQQAAKASTPAPAPKRKNSAAPKTKTTSAPKRKPIAKYNELDDVLGFALHADGRVVAIKQGSGMYGAGFGEGAFSETAFSTTLALSQSTYGWSAAYSVSVWCYRCIELRKKAVSRMAWHVYDARTKQPIPDHPFAIAIRRNRQNLLQRIEVSQLLYGETFIELAKNTDKYVSDLYWLNNNGLTVVIGAGYIEGYQYTAMQGGEPQAFDVSDVAFMRTFNPMNDLRGMSPTEVIMDEIAIDKDVARVVRAYYSNDTRVGLLLIPKRDMQPSDAENFMAMWKSQHQGPNKAGKPILMPSDMSVERVQEPASLDDVQLRESVRREIAAGYGVPLALAGAWDDANYDSVDTQRKSFYEETIIPECDDIATFINTDVLPHFDDTGHAIFKFDYSAVTALGEDVTQRQQFIMSKWQGGTALLDEVRVALGDAPLPNGMGQVLLVPAGMQYVKPQDLLALADRTMAQPQGDPDQPPFGFGDVPPVRVSTPGTDTTDDDQPPPPAPDKPKLLPPHKAALPCYVIVSLADDPAITAIQRKLKLAHPSVKWSDPSSFHVTLVYALSTSQPNLETIKKVLPKSINSLDFEAGPLATFDAKEDGIPLYLSVQSTEVLKALQSGLYGAFQSLGLEMSEYSAPNAWQPHITLGYVPTGEIVPTLDDIVGVRSECLVCSVGDGEGFKEVYVTSLKSIAPVPPPKPPTTNSNKARGSVAYEKDFDPSQPRDDDGQWSSGGGGGSGGSDGGSDKPSAEDNKDHSNKLREHSDKLQRGDAQTGKRPGDMRDEVLSAHEDRIAELRRQRRNGEIEDYDYETGVNEADGDRDIALTEIDNGEYTNDSDPELNKEFSKMSGFDSLNDTNHAMNAHATYNLNEKGAGSVYVDATSQDGLIRAKRSYHYDDDFKPSYIENKEFFIDPDLHGNGIGTNVFSSQVRDASNAGFKEIRTLAGKGYDMNGYYTWARLGYDGALPTSAATKRNKAHEAGFSNASRVSDLMKTKEGRDWWKANGVQMAMSFDLRPGSYSQAVLEAYRKEKGVKAKSSLSVLTKAAASAPADPHGDEIDLSSDEEAALDKVWEQIEKGQIEVPPSKPQDDDNKSSPAPRLSPSSESSKPPPTKAQSTARDELSAWENKALKRGAVKAQGFVAELLSTLAQAEVRDGLQALIVSGGSGWSAVHPLFVKVKRAGFVNEPPTSDAEALAYWRRYDVLQRQIAYDWLADYMAQAFADLPTDQPISDADVQVALDSHHDELAKQWLGTEDAPGALVKLVEAGMAAAQASLDTGRVPNPQTAPAKALDVDWNLLSMQARDFAKSYLYDLIRNIDSTTRAEVQKAISAWIESGESLDVLQTALKKIFTDKTRARVIASTESTRAYAAGSLERYRRADVQKVRWRTVRSAEVCPICEELGKQPPVEIGTGFKSTQGKGWQGYPPQHPGCRCFVQPTVE